MGALSKAFAVVKGAVKDFVADDVMNMGAALAYYTALSFAPLLLLLVTITGSLDESLQQHLLDQMGALIGPSGREVADMVMESTEQKAGGTLAKIAGFGTLLLSATLVFAQLQTSMNRIWGVEPQPGRGLWNWLHKRLLSLSLIGLVIFLLLASLAISALLALLPLGNGVVWQAVNHAVSFGIFGALFAFVFRFLPDVHIPWRDSFVGGFATAVLFVIGKALIGLYLGRSSVGSAYGAAGSLIALLVWVYYTSMILFFGAELTLNYAVGRGARLRPEKHAIWSQESKVKREGKARLPGAAGHTPVPAR